MKTIEEEAKEFASKVAGVVIAGTAITYTIEELNSFSESDFKAGAEFAQRWIPVEEENPPLDESLSESEVKYSITVEVKNGIKIQSAYFNTETGQWRSLITGFILSPTHWRPIELK